MKRPPRRARRCGCGSPTTHRVVMRTPWYDGLRRRIKVRYCARCAAQVVGDAAEGEFTGVLTGFSLRAYRYRGDR